MLFLLLKLYLLQWPFWALLANFVQNVNFHKKELCYLFIIIVPKLHSKFLKNLLRSFRDQLLHNLQRTDKGVIIESVAFAGSIQEKVVQFDLTPNLCGSNHSTTSCM